MNQNINTSNDLLMTQLRTKIDSLNVDLTAKDNKTQVLHNDLASTSRDGNDVQALLGVQEGKKVSIRVERFCASRRALFMIEKVDGSTTVWHENLDVCTVELKCWKWVLVSSKRITRRTGGGPSRRRWNL